jgi:hypothetical protein
MYDYGDQFTYYGTDPYQRRVHMQQRAELITDMFGKKPMDYKEWGNTQGGGFDYVKTWGMIAAGAAIMIAGILVPPLTLLGFGVIALGSYFSYKEDKRMQDGYEKYLYKTSNEARAEFEARIKNQAPAQSAAKQVPVDAPSAEAPEQSTSFSSRQSAPNHTHAGQAKEDAAAKQNAGASIA